MVRNITETITAAVGPQAYNYGPYINSAAQALEEREHHIAERLYNFARRQGLSPREATTAIMQAGLAVPPSIAQQRGETATPVAAQPADGAGQFNDFLDRMQDLLAEFRQDRA